MELKKKQIIILMILVVLAIICLTFLREQAMEMVGVGQ